MSALKPMTSPYPFDATAPGEYFTITTADLGNLYAWVHLMQPPGNGFTVKADPDRPLLLQIWRNADPVQTPRWWNSIWRQPQ